MTNTAQSNVTSIPMTKSSVREELEPSIHGEERRGIARHFRFHDPKLAERFAREKMPMTTLYEAYFDGRADLVGDVRAFLDHRDDLVSYELTAAHVRFFLQRFVPEVAIHSKEQDGRLVRGHYDRGNDFFAAFLGERMVYTSALFREGPDAATLEEAQDAKIDRVCRKVLLRKGESLLDVGCGWGTLVHHAATRFGANATGVTLSKNQTEFGNTLLENAGVADRARILCLDYRDTPKGQFDKITSLEMVEHVGVKNLARFFAQMNAYLKDDGIFLLQWTGLRRGAGGAIHDPVTGMRPEDLIWGLFMNEYIFPGADASLPLSRMLAQMEKAGFEIQSVDNVSIHYAWTIAKWHENWLAHREMVVNAYGERWFRIWNFFLAWSARIAEQGNASCFQVVAHKSRDAFDRAKFVRPELDGSMRASPSMNAE